LRPFRAPSAIAVELGPRTFDVTTRALVMGVLNRTTDSFFSPAATFDMDELLSRAAALVDEGADILDVGGVRAGPGPEVDEAEELERVAPVVEVLCDRFDVAVSVDTWRSSVARACFAAGAVLGNDISGFADPAYLGVAAAAGASVVATHIRLRPRVADPAPVYDDVVATVASFLEDRAGRAEAAGIPARRVIIDAGLDLGKTPEQSLELLRASRQLAGTRHALLLSASNKRFLGSRLDLKIDERYDASLAAAALGVTLGCRVLRVHDVRGTVRVRDAIASVLEAA